MRKWQSEYYKLITEPANRVYYWNCVLLSRASYLLRVRIPKKVEPKKLDNLRPISLLKISKIFEKILKNKMLNFINKNNLLLSEQFGFTTNGSTEQAITTICDKFLDNLNNKQYT